MMVEKTNNVEQLSRGEVQISQPGCARAAGIVGNIIRTSDCTVRCCITPPSSGSTVCTSA